MEDQQNVPAPQRVITGNELADEQRETTPEPLYVNNVELKMTPWDIEFRFAQIIGASAVGLTAVHRGTVTMSLEHAKALHVILGAHLAKFEEKFGTIPYSKKTD